jgi:nucleotide-binding universal stress UspA family protein
MDPTEPELIVVDTRGDYERVVAFAVDHDEFSQSALQWGLDHLINQKDLVILLHARPKLVTSSALSALYTSAEAQERKDSITLLTKLSQPLLNQKFSVLAVSLRGDPRVVIPLKLEQASAEMLVCGSRGMTGMKRVLLGSVGDYWTKHLDIPVVVHRGKSN